MPKTQPATARRRTTTAVSRQGPEGKGIPAWLPVASYAIVTVLLFREFILGSGHLLGTDTLATGYFARAFYTGFVRALHEFPLWNPLLYGGLPFVEGMHGDIFYPPSLALFFLDPASSWGWKMVLHVFLAGVFTYVWLRGLGVRRESAWFGGLVYMMGADLVSLVYPGGDGKLFVSALAPLAFWLADRAATRRRIPDFAAFALGIALVMFTSHMQLAYFLVWGVSLYFLFRVGLAWRADRNAADAARLVGLFALAGVLGVGAAAVQFLPPLEYLRSASHRAAKTVQAEGQTGYQYSTTWSLHPEELASLVVPEFVGDNVQTEVRSEPTYWGRNAFKLNHEYAGLVPLLLLPVLFIRRRTADTWFFTALGVLALLYALGATTPAFRLFYLIPGVSLFRSPSLIIFVYGLSVATLGAMAVDRLLDWLSETKDEKDEARSARRLLWGVAAAFGVLAVLASSGALVGLWQTAVHPDMQPDQVAALQANLPAMRSGFWIAAGLAGLTAWVWHAAARRWMGPAAFVAVLALLAALDLYRVDRPFIRGTDILNEILTPALTTPDESVRFLQDRQARGEVFRVWDLGVYPSPLSNVPAVHGLEQIAGHHGNEYGRYRELIGGDQPTNVFSSELRLLDLLNVQYLITPQPIEADGFEEAFRGSRSMVYRNTNALPRAFLIGEVEVAPPEAAVARLLSREFDFRRVALIEEPLPAAVVAEAEPQGRVEWIERGMNASTLQVTLDRPALLVISENHHPNWNVTVDGQPAPLLRVDHTFRAVPVRAGEHTVRLVYESRILRAGAYTSAVLLLLLLGIAVAPALSGRRTRGGGDGG